MGTRTVLTRQAMKLIPFYARAACHKKKNKKLPFFTRHFSFKI
jgi:hypothetical protein